MEDTSIIKEMNYYEALDFVDDKILDFRNKASIVKSIINILMFIGICLTSYVFGSVLLLIVLMTFFIPFVYIINRLAESIIDDMRNIWHNKYVPNPPKVVDDYIQPKLD